MRKSMNALLTIAGIALVTAGCSESPSAADIEMALVAGQYQAEGAFGALTFTAPPAEGGETVDWLERGASILITLREDGTTIGRFFAPGGDDDGGDLDFDLTGNWTLDDGVVRLQHDADTFLRDIAFNYMDGRLVGEATFSQTVRVELAAR